MLATAHCNNFKRAKWPHAALRRQGYRYLNPTTEQDYGVHIFEDPETHELVSPTVEGRYHIDMLDLNNDTFVFERKVRAAFHKGRQEKPAFFNGSFSEIREVMDVFGKLIDFCIPPIPPPP